VSNTFIYHIHSKNYSSVMPKHKLIEINYNNEADENNETIQKCKRAARLMEGRRNYGHNEAAALAGISTAMLHR
jgi:hypothetical protein